MKGERLQCTDNMTNPICLEGTPANPRLTVVSVASWLKRLSVLIQERCPPSVLTLPWRMGGLVE